MALRCGSDEALDTFLLHREGSDTPPQRLRVQGTDTPAQVTFTLSPVTSAHEGTYRCYGSHSNDPYLWSHPSDPLQLEVSGESQPSVLCPLAHCLAGLLESCLGRVPRWEQLCQGQHQAACPVDPATTLSPGGEDSGLNPGLRPQGKGVLRPSHRAPKSRELLQPRAPCQAHPLWHWMQLVGTPSFQPALNVTILDVAFESCLIL